MRKPHRTNELCANEDEIVFGIWNVISMKWIDSFCVHIAHVNIVFNSEHDNELD